MSSDGLQLDELVETIFSKPARQACTIQLGIDYTAQSPADAASFLFEFLLDFLLRGIKFLWNKTPASMTMEEFGSLRPYVNSIGFEVHLDRAPAGEPEALPERSHDLSKLHGYHMQFTAHDELHDVWFDFLIPQTRTSVQ